MCVCARMCVCGAVIMYLKGALIMYMVFDLRISSIQEGILNVKQICILKIRTKGRFVLHSVFLCVFKGFALTPHTQEEVIGRGHRQQLHVRMTMSKGIMLGMN